MMEKLKVWFLGSVIALLHCLGVGYQMDHITAYNSKLKETLLTLEGEPKEVRQKYRRFLSFNNDQSNIRVEMVFAVPFLQIPIGGKTVEGPYGSGVTPVVDVNTKSLVTASVLLFMLFFIIPKLVRVFVPKTPSSRAHEENEFSRVVHGVEMALGVNATACWQRGICWTIQGGRQRVQTGRPNSWDKIVDGISSVTWLDSIFMGTSFGEAWQHGKLEKNGCDLYFTQCPLSQEKLRALFKDIFQQYVEHLRQLTAKATHRNN